MINWVINGLKGMAMGMAEVVPGVSGGTIALITGIYEKLIYTIRNIDKSFFHSLLRGDIQSIKRVLDLPFIFSLFSGMGLGIIMGVFGITYLFENFPEPLWGFFFGLILASCLYVGKNIKIWSGQNIAILAFGTILAYLITIISPVSGSTSMWYVFISGMIAICALILPGISGSFILLLLGMYAVIIQTVKSFLVHPNLEGGTVLAVFALGCLTGIAGFSRIMGFLFKKYYNGTLALLVGFMLGSLNKIWPWRNVSEILDKKTFKLFSVHSIEDLKSYNESGYKVLAEVNVLPQDYWMGTSKVALTIFCFLFGFALLFAIDRIARKFK